MSAEKIRKDAESALEAAASSARDDLETVKAQLEQFVQQHILPKLSDAATSAAANVKDIAQTQKKSVATQVSTQPLLSIGISAVVGFVLGRLSR
ncbi:MULTISPECIES: DUF883 family protein [Acetobacter]|uniref:DUF883 family protein n=1 Tax=Acetobacter sacchari TaxID=2661687 RepID=A0ABS3LTR9_9PROT|nr:MULTISPECIES: DUF883 family protein [Acetobacter]MBO1359299.1 DUF883 family protein [Acetobacter sacchari]OUJ11619.1 hypothetical protein HK28_04540 [Acetobacter sp. DsW_063]